MILRALLVLALLAPAPVGAQQARPADPAGVFVVRLEEAAAAGNPQAIVAMGVAPDAPGLRSFAAVAVPRPARVIIKERDRSVLTPAGERLLIEVFSESGGEASITSWRLDLEPDPASATARRIREMEQLTVVTGLYKLALDPATQFDVRNLVVKGTDLTLEMTTGVAFVAKTEDGPTAVVLMGKGRMQFAPSDPAERTQVRILANDDALTSDFDAAFVRVKPEDFKQAFGTGTLVPRAVAGGDLRRASGIFDDYIGQTLNLDLRDLSRDRWSLIPSTGDLIAEVRTRRLGSLTYARSTKDAEDITLFDRKRRRNIAVYASAQKLASRGRFYGEDELVEYDVQHRELDVAFNPDRMWVEGSVALRLRIRAYAVSSITLRLAEALSVRNVATVEHGRLLHLRVIGQNSIIINFPTTLVRNTELTVYVSYGGRLEPQQIDREGLVLDQQGNVQREELVIPIEPQYIYSNRSYWYPQSTVTDYATSSMRVTVPPEFDVVASGRETGLPAPAPGGVEPGQRARKLYVFESERPVRYLSCVISRFQRVATRQLSIPARPPAGTAGPSETAAAAPFSGDGEPGNRAASGEPQAGRPASQVTLNVHANPRQTGRARSMTDRTAAIFEFYAGIVGDAPYESFTLAVTESDLPGGHSPAYFAILNQPLPLTQAVWRNDPVAFDGYPPYFLAHEIAHQWWGQAVGWKNYHEQWLSEGFAQYFAALYAERDRGEETFTGMMRQMRRWAIEQSAQGPVYLGYRLGHIKGEGRVFRALVYNKGAVVLHMLRRLAGDDKFFEGLRRFYTQWRFKKAGTDDFRAAMEKASGLNLAPFFDAWIYGSSIPALRFTSAVGATDVTLKFEHLGEVMPVPVTVTISYGDGSSTDLMVPVTERLVERVVPLKGSVKSIEVNRDHAAVAEIER